MDKEIQDQRRAGTVTRIEALGYRSLRYVSQSVSPFQVLVGANASGKSTFLDTVAFLGDLLRGGLEAAVRGDVRIGMPQRAPDARHLVWMRGGTRFEIAVEMAIPADRRLQLKNGQPDVCRYEIAVDTTGPLRLVSETLWLKASSHGEPRQRRLFPEPRTPPSSIVHPPRKKSPAGWKKVVTRSEEPERVTFISETSGWNNPFRLGADKAALSSLPEDEERFPVATWLRRLLEEGIQRIMLSSEAMRRPSPSSRSVGFLPDGSNLPWVAHALKSKDPERFRSWLEHVREALPDVKGITTREREEDRHRYLIVRYRSGLEAPSWLVSDGTLRLLGLTMLAYAADVSGIYLVEEPENGIHPRAIETVYQSLSSVYGAQVLLATHAPVVLSMAEPADLLCLARDEEGATDIVRGNEHPRLKEWKGGVELGTLLASGVLG